MKIPYVIDNQTNRLADVLNGLLAEHAGRSVDVATAYFTVQGYRLVKDGLNRLGTFRLLLGAEPHAGEDLGLHADAKAVKVALTGDLNREPFTEDTLRLIEDLSIFNDRTGSKITGGIYYSQVSSSRWRSS